MRHHDLGDLEAFFLEWSLTSFNFTQLHIPLSEIFVKLPAAINIKHGQTCSVLNMTCTGCCSMALSKFSILNSIDTHKKNDVDSTFYVLDCCTIWKGLRGS